MKLTSLLVIITALAITSPVLNKAVSGQSSDSGISVSKEVLFHTTGEYKGLTPNANETNQNGFPIRTNKNQDKFLISEYNNAVIGPSDNQCAYSVELTDSYGDGWNGNVLGFRQGGTIVGTFGQDFTNGFTYGPVYVALNHNVSTEIVVVTIGDFTSEVGFVVKDPYGATVYARNPGINFTLYTIFTTFTSNCTPPACMKPTLTDPTSITTTSAILNWTAPLNPPLNGYQYEVRTSGAGGSGNNGLLISGNTPAGITSATVTGLSPSSTYYIYVRSSCDNNTFSEWSGPKIFSTSCATLTVLHEDFENLFPPVCWTLINNGAGNNWSRSDNPYSGLYSLTYSYDSVSPANAWAFTGAFGLIAGRTYVISFYQSIGDDEYPEKLKVTMGTSPAVAAQTTTLWNNAGGSQLTNMEWIERKIEFVSPATGTYFFGFNCYSDADMFELYVDNISILEKPQVDLSLSDLYQTSASLAPENGYSQGNFIIVNRKSTSILSLPGERDDKTPEQITGNENITPVTLQPAVMYPSIPVEVDALVSNAGVQPSGGTIDWSVGGVIQPPYSISAISSGNSQITNLYYSPSARGTYLVDCSVSATGDSNPYNDSRSIRIRVYPDNFSRIVYDRGDNTVDSWVGYNSAVIRTKTGVRFTASKDIKLAGVDYICRTESITSGSFVVQVRASGATPGIPGAVLYTRSFNTSDYLPNGNNGDYITFPFDDTAPVITGGSDYWITIKAPLGVLNPAATHHSGFTAGRSFYEANGDTTIWYPLVIGTEKAWLMRAITVSPTIPGKTLAVKAYLEGFWNGTSMNKAQDANSQGETWDKFGGTVVDTLSILLANGTAPFSTVYAVHGVNLNTNGSMSMTIPGDYSGGYYLIIIHRQGVETWSAMPVSFSGSDISYDFTTSASQAFGSNQKSLGMAWGIFTGDVSQNGYVELNDVNAVFNSVRSSGYGYILYDINGNGFAEVDDLNKTFSNQRLSAGRMVPSY